MALARFSIIVAVDAGNGIAKNGDLPWNSRDDMRHFRDTTVGRGRNAIILGRKTYLSIPEERRPLQNRDNIVISSTWTQDDNPGVVVYPTLLDALSGLGSFTDKYDEIFICGGEMVYNECVRDYMYLCNRIIVTKFKLDYKCDQFFPFDQVSKYKYCQEPTKCKDHTRYYFSPNEVHDEYKYLDLLNRLRTNGEYRVDRTGVGVKSLFSEKLDFDLSERFPLLTTKRVNFDAIVKELLFFISGKTDSNILKEQGVNIWCGNTSKEFLQARGLDYPEGDIGPAYPISWRHWGVDYKGSDFDYTDQGIDQLSKLIEQIRTDPMSRRHILMNWDVSQVDKCPLPPCFIAGTLVLTTNGYKNIEDVVYEDKLISHKGIPRDLKKIYVTPYSGVIKNIRVAYHPHKIRTTPEHPFYVKKTKFDKVKWVNASNIEEGSFIGFPINKENIVPSFKYIKKTNATVTKEITFTLDNPEYWYVMGYYLGDGWLDWKDNKKFRFSFIFNNADMDISYPRIKNIVNLYEVKSKATKSVRVFEGRKFEWWNLLKEFGHLAHNKKIPEWVHNAPIEYIKKFIEGYKQADGCKKINSLLTATTVSPHIAFGMQRLFAKLGNIISVRFQKKPKTHIIEGRTVNQRDLYYIDGRYNTLGKSYIDEGYVWYEVKSIEDDEVEDENVYNFEVEKDHTYIVENLAVHNCHLMSQFYVSGDKRYIDCRVNMRSSDVFLGLPFNIASYALLTHMIGYLTGLKPRRLIMELGDVHMYMSHTDQVNKQVKRTPRSFPILKLRNVTRVHKIDDFTSDHFEIERYNPCPFISAPMAV